MDPYTTAVPPAVERGTEQDAIDYLAGVRGFPPAAVDAALEEARRFPGRYAYLPPHRYAYVVKHSAMPAATWTAGDSTATEQRIASLAVRRRGLLAGS